jgi:hypothetical protein
MRTELGLLKRTVLPATNTVGALQQIQTEISSLAFGGTHWARNKEVKENNNNNKKTNPILVFYIQTRGAQTTI